MAVAEIDGAGIAVHTEYRERDLIKQVPGAKWDNDARVWRTPLSWAACMQLRGVFGADLRVGAELNEWARLETTGRVLPCLELREAEDAPDLEILTALFPFQRAGVKFLVTARQALLGDDMGCGKTVQAIAALEVARAYPALIVTTKSMMRTWADELAKWAPSVKAIPIFGGAAGRRKLFAQAEEAIAAGERVAVIVNWEGLRSHSRLAGYGYIKLSDKEKEPAELNAIDWETVIADEAHKAKDPKSKQTRALWAAADGARYRFALTGTPVVNAPEDLWAIMRFVSPQEWPAKTQFVDRYALQSWNHFGFMETSGIKSETREEMFKILDPRFIRRPKAVVLPQLPPKVYTRRVVDLTAKQRKAYDGLRKEMIAELDNGTLLATNPLIKFLRLTQFASAHGELGPQLYQVSRYDAGSEGYVAERKDVPSEGEAVAIATALQADGVQRYVQLQDRRLALTEPSCKVDAMLEVASELGGRKAIVFAESRQLIEITAARLIKEGYGVAQITGSVDPAQRGENVRRFQEGDLQLLLLTIGAGGEGLTLTAADTAVFLQRSYSAAKNKQAEDRLHRIGQTAEHVEIVDIVAHDTVEYEIHASLIEKGLTQEDILRDQETIARWLGRKS